MLRRPSFTTLDVIMGTKPERYKRCIHLFHFVLACLFDFVFVSFAFDLWLLLLFSCLFFDLFSFAAGLIPLGLAVTFQNNGKCTRDHVTYVKPYFPANYSGKIVIGSKLAYGNINAQLIIEWVEAMRYIGVDKIVTYFLGTLNSDALNVLFHYAAEGFVDLSLYDPAKEGDYCLFFKISLL